MRPTPVLLALMLIGNGTVFGEPGTPFSGSVFNFFDDLGPFQSRRESSSNEDIKSNGDAQGIEPGETLILGDLEGPGMITHIWNTVGSYDPFFSRALVLRIYWDGADHPSVEVPLGDFFGVGHGAFSDFTSLPVSVSSRGRARNCFWPMPFRKRALVTVTNESKTYRTDSFYYYLDWRKYQKDLPDEIPYFHARYRQETPAHPGNYTILETTGSGFYVGTVYSVHQVELGWFGEGDDWFYIDGEELPSLRGTGTEDYFGDAWGFRKFSTPFYGVSLWEGYFPGDRVTAYRWHIPDPVAFSKSLKVAIEHRGSVFTDQAVQVASSAERPDWISSAAFWYQTPIITFSERIPLVSERIAPYRVLPAKSLAVSATPVSGLSHDGPTLNFRPMRDDAVLEVEFEVEKPGRYQLNAILWYSLFGGVYQPVLDGRAISGPIDFCATGNDPGWVRLDLHDLSPGKHRLRFEGRGSSPNRRTLVPPVNSFGMTYLILLRLEDMEGYHRLMEEKLRQRRNQP